MEKEKTVFEVYKDFLKVLCGYDLDFYQKTGVDVRIEGNELCFYEDVSYHGSPSIVKTNTLQLTPNQAYILQTMLDMKREVEQVDAEKQVAEIEKQKGFLNQKLDFILKSGKLEYSRK